MAKLRMPTKRLLLFNHKSNFRTIVTYGTCSAICFTSVFSKFSNIDLTIFQQILHTVRIVCTVGQPSMSQKHFLAIWRAILKYYVT